VEKYCRSGRPQMTIWRMHFACRITGYRHSLKYVNTYCFFTVVVVTRTRLGLTFISIPVVLLTLGVYGDGFFFLSKKSLQGSRQFPLFQSYLRSTSDVQYFSFTVCILRSSWSFL
jgi:hypothetical protein